jgi:hypothetical protein
LKFICNYIVLTISYLLLIYSAAECSNLPAIKELEGDWIAKHYLESVQNTHLTFSDNPEWIEISSAKLSWANGHEGYFRKIIHINKTSKKNEFRIVFGEREIDDPKPSEMISVLTRVKKDASGKIYSITFLEGLDEISSDYERIPTSIEKYLNKLLLVGRYKDAKGRIYSFDEAGIAHWPLQTFSYEFYLDSFNRNKDYFYIEYITHDKKTLSIVTGPIAYGFKWKHGRLEIFQISGDELDYKEGPPLLILDPIKK